VCVVLAGLKMRRGSMMKLRGLVVMDGRHRVLAIRRFLEICHITPIGKLVVDADVQVAAPSSESRQILILDKQASHTD
jgi:hypothetical protein